MKRFVFAMVAVLAFACVADASPRAFFGRGRVGFFGGRFFAVGGGFYNTSVVVPAFVNPAFIGTTYSTPVAVPNEVIVNPAFTSYGIGGRVVFINGRFFRR